MSMKKYLIIFTVLLAVACTRNDLWDKIQSAFDQGAESILIKDYTDFDWDAVCILGPYSIQSHKREETLAKFIPYDLGEFKDKIPNFGSDGQWAFAFIKDDKMIALENKGRGYYLRDGNRKKTCISYDEAMLKKDPRIENYLLINAGE